MEEDFPKLLHQVRLPFVSLDFLLDELIKDELITKNPVFCSTFVINAMKVVLSSTEGQASQLPRKCQESHIEGMFICGGKRALCYFPQNDIWYRLADSPFQDYERHTLTQCKSKIYIVDGKTRQLGESCVAEYYSPQSNSWGVVQRNDVVTDLTCCTFVKGDMYVTCFSKLHKKVKVCRYDRGMTCWQEIAAQVNQQDKACVVANKQFLYIIGGTVDGGKTAVCTTNIFDPINKKLEEVGNLKWSRYNACGASMNSKVFIAGGWSSIDFYLQNTEAYNPSTNEWQLMAELTIPRFSSSMVCFEGRLFVFGGTTYTERDGMIRALTVEMFHPESNVWEEVSAIPIKSFEMPHEKNKYQACFARLNKKVIDELDPLK